MRIKKIDIWAFGALIGVSVAVYSLVITLASVLMAKLPSMIVFLTNIQQAWLALVIDMLFKILFGVITGVIVALLYNLIVKWKGGFKIELADAKKKR